MLTHLIILMTSYQLGYAIGFFSHLLWSFFPAGFMISLIYILYRISKTQALSRIK